MKILHLFPIWNTSLPLFDLIGVLFPNFKVDFGDFSDFSFFSFLSFLSESDERDETVAKPLVTGFVFVLLRPKSKIEPLEEDLRNFQRNFDVQ